MNAKDPEIIDRFIQLRVQGWTFERIASELSVTERTLMTWSRKHSTLIQNLRALETEKVAHRANLTSTATLENLGEDIRRVREELARRDLKDIPTDKLLMIAARHRKEAVRATTPPQLSEPVTEAMLKDEPFPDPNVSWTA